MQQGNLKEKILDKNKITKNSMAEELQRAKVQQYINELGKTDFSFFYNDKQEKTNFEKAAKLAKTDNGSRISVDKKLPKEMIVSAQYPMRANEDYTASSYLNYDLSHFSDEEIRAAAFDAIKLLNEKFAQDKDIAGKSVGSTLTACIVVRTGNITKIFTIQIGDAAAVYVSDKGAEQLAYRHNIKDEKERILREGGNIIQDRIIGQLDIKDGATIKKKGITLNTPRVLGGYISGTPGLSIEPDVSLRIIKNNESLSNILVLTSDGFYADNNASYMFGLKNLFIDKANNTINLTEYAKAICGLGQKSIVTFQNPKIDDTTATAFNLNELQDGKTIISIVADGNGQPNSTDNPVALKACELLPDCLIQALNKIASLQNVNNNQTTQTPKNPVLPQFSFPDSAYSASTDYGLTPSQNTSKQEKIVDMQGEIKIEEGWLKYESEQSSQESSETPKKTVRSNSQTAVLAELNNDNGRSKLKSSGDCSSTDVVDNTEGHNAQFDDTYLKRKIKLITPTSTPTSSPQKKIKTSATVRFERDEEDNKENDFSDYNSPAT